MEENNEILLTLKRIERSNRMRLLFSLGTCLFMMVVAVCCLVLSMTVMELMPQVNNVLSELEQVTWQLSNLELEDMVYNINSMAISAQDGLQLTMQKLDTLDIDSLNQAIADLADVVSVLSRFAQMFK